MSNNMISINVQHTGKKSTIIISKLKTVKDLFSEIRKFPDMENASFHLVLEGNPIEENHPGTLDSKGFRSGCTIHLCINAIGGSRNITPLPGLVTLTSDEPCCIMGDDDPNVKRVKMPCQCVFGVDILKTYCETKVKDGSYFFPCANECVSIWPSEAVSHVTAATMKESEFELFSQKVNENYLNSALSIRQCPTCQNFITRNPEKVFLNPNWIVCSLCGGQGFCWVCQKSWLGDRKSCGNSGCDGKDPRLAYLQNCETKTIGNVSGVPKIRCCEKCGMLIQHSDKCKHMTCVKCKYDFCFVCLKPKKKIGEEEEWQCGAYNSVCSVAPRQTAIFDFQPIIKPDYSDHSSADHSPPVKEETSRCIIL